MNFLLTVVTLEWAKIPFAVAVPTAVLYLIITYDSDGKVCIHGMRIMPLQVAAVIHGTRAIWLNTSFGVVVNVNGVRHSAAQTLEPNTPPRTPIGPCSPRARAIGHPSTLIIPPPLLPCVDQHREVEHARSMGLGLLLDTPVESTQDLHWCFRP